MTALSGHWSGLCRGTVVTGPESVGDALSLRFGGLSVEALFALLLGPDRRVLECALVGLGRGHVDADPSMVLRPLLAARGEAVIVAHTHPSGSTSPSEADLAFTRRLLCASEIVGAELLDHIIIARDCWRSLRESTQLWSDE